MTILTLQPSNADTYIDFSNPTFNYGVAAECRIGVSGGDYQRGLFHFDISALPAGATITSAVLSLYGWYEATAADKPVACHRMLRQWYEGAKSGAAPDAGQDASNWNLRNANGAVAWGAVGGQSGTDYAAVATASVTWTAAAQWYNFDVLADVLAWYAGTASNFGWMLLDATAVNNGIRFRTREYATDATLCPKLVVTYTEAASPAAHGMIRRGARRIIW